MHHVLRRITWFLVLNFFQKNYIHHTPYEVLTVKNEDDQHCNYIGGLNVLKLGPLLGWSM